MNGKITKKHFFQIWKVFGPVRAFKTFIDNHKTFINDSGNFWDLNK